MDRRLWQKIERGEPPETRPDLGPCWLWSGATTSKGYASVRRQGVSRLGHRLVWSLFRGSLPEDLQVDHLCRVHRCVRPTHLEPVTCQVNLLRGETLAAANAAKTHCPQEHPYDQANTYHGLGGRRHCRICRRDWARRARAGKRNNAQAA